MMHRDPKISEGIFTSIASKETSIKGFHLFISSIAEDFALVEIDLQP
jgi:hypothetical protein